MTETEKNWVLSLPKETKLQLLNDMLDKGETGLALQFQMILLNAPISEGGISAETLENLWNKRD